MHIHCECEHRGLLDRMAEKLDTLIREVSNLNRKVNAQMALTDDMKAAVTALVAEEGVVASVLSDLAAKASQQGSVSDADVQAAVAQINSSVADLTAAAVAADPTFVPPVPAGN